MKRVLPLQAFLTAAVALAAPYSSNLVVNGDAETAGIAGWIGGPLVAQGYLTDGGEHYPTTASPGPSQRGAYFFFAGPTNDSVVRQRIDARDNAAEVDALGVRCEVEAWLGGWGPQDDTARLDVLFLASPDASIPDSWSPDGGATPSELTGFLSLGPVSAAERMNVTGLLFKRLGTVVPPGTRTIEVRVTMDYQAGGDNDGYWDEARVTLFPLDAGMPDAGAGDAGSNDAGAQDAGGPDAGPFPDAGLPDAAFLDGDAGAPDAGPVRPASDGGVQPSGRALYGVGCSSTSAWASLPLLMLLGWRAARASSFSARARHRAR